MKYKILNFEPKYIKRTEENKIGNDTLQNFNCHKEALNLDDGRNVTTREQASLYHSLVICTLELIGDFGAMTEMSFAVINDKDLCNIFL